MAKYRVDLPQLSGDVFLTDGGLETTLIFHDGRDLPEFAAFVLLDHDNGRHHPGRANTSRLGHLNVLGGCCGADDRHVARIVAACTS
jgi:S-methylmethionine-dependent homocysteine/selenocysteine methylase